METLQAILVKIFWQLTVQEIWDGLYIRYNILLKCVPSLCVCGAAFKLEHPLSCPKGGFMSIQHNEVRDFTAELLLEYCKDVSTKPVPQQRTTEILPPSAIQLNEARVNVEARKF